ncbi:CotY/CotZ family spore coat protein [Lysinibacillus parviboronicapiens]|uniref:CotY/CotZ family spore coat protein n=1 Tax=Lysinibacillus parviboronicapiens TaxID=436516 RepID=UPI000D37D5C9|nr:CotY/CotZ family spore coat protein [Lysinibacillus parviboronicapiens]
MSIEKGRKHFVCEALSDIKALQDVITNFHSKYYGQLLMKIVGSDTIPLFLITNNGAHLRLLDTGKQFETEYFRIESIDKERCRGTISLLRAYDYEGNETDSNADVVRLERTSTEKSIDLSSISAIQLLNPDLLKRKIIIEPKW